MADGMAQFFISSVAATDWEPFPVSDVVDGEPDGRVHWLRNEGDGLQAGLFTAQRSRFHYVCPGEETFQLLSGRVTIELEGEPDPVPVGSGDIVSFRKGARSTWTVEEPITEFFVIHD